MTDWQPIETAPLNTNIIIYLDNDGCGHRIWIAHASLLGGWCQRDETIGGDIGFYLSETEEIGVTHWMPLPEPPK